MGRDCYLTFWSNRYSVPWRHGDKDVLVRVRADERLEILSSGEIIATYPLAPGRGQTVTTPGHLDGLREAIFSRRKDRMEAAGNIVPEVLARFGPAPDVEVRDLSLYEQMEFAAAKELKPC